MGYQGPGEPENIQRVERRAVREDYFCSGMEDPLNIVLNLNQNSRISAHKQVHGRDETIPIVLGGDGVQGQVKGQRLMSIFVVNDFIWLATCHSKIYKK